MHPHGVLYTKSEEGATYAGSGSGSTGNAVAPGDTHLYTWKVRHRRVVFYSHSLAGVCPQVPESAGPSDNDGSSERLDHKALSQPLSCLLSRVICPRHSLDLPFACERSRRCAVTPFGRDAPSCLDRNSCSRLCFSRHERRSRWSHHYHAQGHGARRWSVCLSPVLVDTHVFRFVATPVDIDQEVVRGGAYAFLHVIYPAAGLLFACRCLLTACTMKARARCLTTTWNPF
jgi:hypothetical protein